jgi:hypothetical protein
VRQDAEPPQREGDRRLRQPGGPADQRLGGVQQRGVAFDQRAAGGVQPDRCVQRDRAAADPDGEEVVVGRPPFPQPLGPADQRPQAWRVGVEVVGGGELGGRQLVGGGRHLRQVGEVAGSLPAPGLAGGPSLVKAQRDSSPSEATAVPATATTSSGCLGPGTANRNASDPAPPSIGTRYCSHAAVAGPGHETVGGAATSSSPVGSG